MNPNDQAAIQEIAGQLEQAWNAGDSAKFVSAFAEDADFVNVYGMHLRGKHAIQMAHEMIFRTVYAGSFATWKVTSMRPLSDDVALVHLAVILNVPQGAMAGEHPALPSAVLVRRAGAWEIAAFHNTFVKNPPAISPLSRSV
jgi:uncharacterized protein (TIGR02246 family)